MEPVLTELEKALNSANRLYRLFSGFDSRIEHTHILLNLSNESCAVVDFSLALIKHINAEMFLKMFNRLTDLKLKTKEDFSEVTISAAYEGFYYNEIAFTILKSVKQHVSLHQMNMFELLYDEGIKLNIDLSYISEGLSLSIEPYEIIFYKVDQFGYDINLADKELDVLKLINASFDKRFTINEYVHHNSTCGKKTRRQLNRNSHAKLGDKENTFIEYLRLPEVLEALLTTGENAAKEAVIKNLKKQHKLKRIDVFKESYGWESCDETEFTKHHPDIVDFIYSNKAGLDNVKAWLLSGIDQVFTPVNRTLYVDLCTVDEHSKLTAIIKLHPHVKRYVDLYKMNLNRDKVYTIRHLCEFNVEGFALTKI